MAIVRARTFNPGALFEEVRLAARMREDDPEPDQLRYLASYLRKGDTPARTMVIEGPYYRPDFAAIVPDRGLHHEQSYRSRQSTGLPSLC
jgi:hypothetical protein